MQPAIFLLQTLQRFGETKGGNWVVITFQGEQAMSTAMLQRCFQRVIDR